MNETFVLRMQDYSLLKLCAYLNPNLNNQANFLLKSAKMKCLVCLGPRTADIKTGAKLINYFTSMMMGKWWKCEEWRI